MPLLREKTDQDGNQDDQERSRWKSRWLTVSLKIKRNKTDLPNKQFFTWSKDYFWDLLKTVIIFNFVFIWITVFIHWMLGFYCQNHKGQQAGKKTTNLAGRLQVSHAFTYLHIHMWQLCWSEPEGGQAWTADIHLTKNPRGQRSGRNRRKDPSRRHQCPASRANPVLLCLWVPALLIPP